MRSKRALRLKIILIERKLNALDAFSHYGIAASVQAVADSGIDAKKESIKMRLGVIWGSGIGGLDTFQTETFNFAKGDGTPRFNPFFIPKMIADICSGHISIRFGFRGPKFHNCFGLCIFNYCFNRCFYIYQVR